MSLKTSVQQFFMTEMPGMAQNSSFSVNLYQRKSKNAFAVIKRQRKRNVIFCPHIRLISPSPEPWSFQRNNSKVSRALQSLFHTEGEAVLFFPLDQQLTSAGYRGKLWQVWKHQTKPRPKARSWFFQFFTHYHVFPIPKQNFKKSYPGRCSQAMNILPEIMGV